MKEYARARGRAVPRISKSGCCTALALLIGCSGGGSSGFIGESTGEGGVESVTPAAVRVGDSEIVVIRGERLALEEAGVSMARVVWTPVDAPAASREIPGTIVDDSTLSFVAPARNMPGPIDLEVEVLNEAEGIERSLRAGYAVYELSPASGAVEGGTRVTVEGLEFQGSEASVAFDEVEAEVVEIDAAQRRLIVRAPAVSSARTVDVRVRGFVIPLGDRDAQQELTIVNGFQYRVEAPGMSSIEPDGALIAESVEVEILGERFTEDVIIEVDGEPLLDQEVLGEDRVVGRVPPGRRIGPVEVVARNGVGDSDPLTFTYRFAASLRRRSVTPAPIARTDFGRGLDMLSDVSGDGFGDFVAGSPLESNSDGAVYFFSGIDAREILYTVSGNSEGECLGWAVARLRGDVDFDGIEDAIASSPNAGAGRGAIYVLSPGRRRVHARIGGQPGDVGLGVSLLSLGDIDSDGIPDFAAGLTSTAGSPNGAVRVFSGGDPSVQVNVAAPDASVVDFGISLDMISDLDGDGFDDVAIGSRGDGVTTFGAAFAFTSGTRQEVMRVGGMNDPPFATGPVAGVTDLNGDGLGELAFAADDGRVRVVAGVTRELLCILEVGAEVSDMAVAGDMNRDGLPDLAVGSANFGGGPGQPGPGLLLIFSGHDGEVIHRAEGGSPDAELGRSVAAGGDLHRDGLPDVLVAAPAADVESVTRRGAVYAVSQDNLVPRATTIANGEDLVFDLLAPAEAGAPVFVAFAFGNSPGIKVGPRTIPLTNDVLFQVSLQIAQFRGELDEGGYFQMRLTARDLDNVPFRGLPIFAAMISLDATPEVVVISNGTSFVLE